MTRVGVSWDRYRKWARSRQMPGGLYMVDTIYDALPHIKFGKAKNDLSGRPSDSRWHDPQMTVLAVVPVTAPGLSPTAYARLLNGLENMLMEICRDLQPPGAGPAALTKELLVRGDDEHVKQCLDAFVIFASGLDEFVKTSLRKAFSSGAPQSHVECICWERMLGLRDVRSPPRRVRRVGGPLPCGGKSYLKTALPQILSSFPPLQLTIAMQNLETVCEQDSRLSMPGNVALSTTRGSVQLAPIKSFSDSNFQMSLLYGAAKLLTPTEDKEWRTSTSGRLRARWWDDTLSQLQKTRIPKGRFATYFPHVHVEGNKTNVGLAEVLQKVDRCQLAESPAFLERLWQEFVPDRTKEDCVVRATVYRIPAERVASHAASHDSPTTRSSRQSPAAPTSAQPAHLADSRVSASSPAQSAILTSAPSTSGPAQSTLQSASSAFAPSTRALSQAASSTFAPSASAAVPAQNASFPKRTRSASAQSARSTDSTIAASIRAPSSGPLVILSDSPDSSEEEAAPPAASRRRLNLLSSRNLSSLSNL
jgi:hypothetical protein